MNNCANTFSIQIEVLYIHSLKTSLLLISISINLVRVKVSVTACNRKQIESIFIVKITFGRVVRLADMYIQPYNKSITFSSYAENNSLSTELIHYYGRKIHLHSVHSHTNKLKLSDLLHTWTNCLLALQVSRQVPMPEKRDIKNFLKMWLAEEKHST